MTISTDTKRSVLIFAKTKYAQTPYDKWLDGTDIVPIIITTEDFAPGYSHMSYVYAFANYDQNRLVEKMALHLAQTHKPIAVFARAEADIIRAAQLRDLLGIPGQSIDSALAFRNKVVMKDALQGSGVKLPSYCIANSAYTIISFVEQNGYPVVIKPFAESGSFGTVIIRSESELDSFLASPQRPDLEIEKFIEGQMYHVDGLIVDGKIDFIHPFRYMNDCMSFRQNDFVASLSLSSQDPAYCTLINTTKKILDALPTPRHTAFHAEIWITPKGEPIFCEIASRTGGGMICATINHCFGFNIDQRWLLAECSVDNELKAREYKPGGGVVIPPLNGLLEYLPKNQEPAYVRESQYTAKAGQRFSGGVKSGLFLAGYVVDGDNEHDVARNVLGVASWFAQQSKWSHVK